MHCIVPHCCISLIKVEVWLHTYLFTLQLCPKPNAYLMIPLQYCILCAFRTQHSARMRFDSAQFHSIPLSEHPLTAIFIYFTLAACIQLIIQNEANVYSAKMTTTTAQKKTILLKQIKMKHTEINNIRAYTGNSETNTCKYTAEQLNGSYRTQNARALVYTNH